MRRYNTEIEREFVAFLKAQDGKEDGTASTYHRALVILNKVFERVRPDYLNGQYDIWKISSPSDLMRIYEIIKEEQTVQGWTKENEGVWDDRRNEMLDLADEIYKANGLKRKLYGE